jgi:uncharacterized cofD-like protein
MKSKPSVVTIGGGTGSFVVLSGLKDYPIDLSAVVTMMDSGGSTGKLRDQLGVLPPGDLRQALVALSEAPDIWRKLFTYRFENGDLKGHNFGNIFLSAIEKIANSNQEAVDRASDILQTNGRVIPITFDKSSLCAIYEDRTVVEGESNIEKIIKRKTRISKVYLKPSALINLEAKRSIERADYLIFGPGDLYTSVIPNLLVDGMREIMRHLKAKKIFIINLMTKPGQTEDYKVSTFIDELEKYLGEGSLDYIIVNSTKLKKELISIYKKIDKASPVEDDVGDRYRDAKVIKADVLSDVTYVRSSSDELKRSLIRHDSDKLASVLYKIIKS